MAKYWGALGTYVRLPVEKNGQIEYKTMKVTKKNIKYVREFRRQKEIREKAERKRKREERHKEILKEKEAKYKRAVARESAQIFNNILKGQKNDTITKERLLRLNNMKNGEAARKINDSNNAIDEFYNIYNSLPQHIKSLLQNNKNFILPPQNITLNDIYHYNYDTIKETSTQLYNYLKDSVKLIVNTIQEQISDNEHSLLFFDDENINDLEIAEKIAENEQLEIVSNQFESLLLSFAKNIHSEFETKVEEAPATQEPDIVKEDIKEIIRKASEDTNRY